MKSKISLSKENLKVTYFCKILDGDETLNEYVTDQKGKPIIDLRTGKQISSDNVTPAKFKRLSSTYHLLTL